MKLIFGTGYFEELISRDFMHDLLSRYLHEYPSDLSLVTRFLELWDTGPDSLVRTNFHPGHFTGSAWILSPDQERAALIHHRKLNRWMQPGGHADGDSDLSRVAHREAIEETGLVGLRLLNDIPLDLDIHHIPSRGDEPEHEHFDLRFLFLSDSEQFAENIREVKGISWVPLQEISEELQENRFEASVARMARKSLAKLAAFSSLKTG